jgi:virginiamycin B lyase
MRAAAMVAGIGLAAGAGFLAISRPAAGQTSASAILTGRVTSAQEGPMEGVLVSAKKAGSTITVTVVSDATGHYRFPADRLEPGSYTISIRAAGYELDGPAAVEVAPHQPVTADLKLKTAQNLSAQLNNAEWMMSMPGTDQEKRFLLNCVTCHTLERVVRSKHPADEFMNVLQRMGDYVNQSSPLRPQLRKADRLYEERGEARTRNRLGQSAYLAKINLSSGPNWSYDLKTLPRPKGKGTQVIITEYDLPRRTIQPHDVILDEQGIVWYSNFGEQAVGKMDPKTGKVTEFQVPITKPGFPTGELGLQMDRAGYLWFGMMYQAGVARFDRKTEQFQVFPIPQDFNKDMTQINMPAPQFSHVDGKVWTQNNGFAVVHRIDLATGRGETFKPFGDPKDGENHNIYDIIPDSQNNLYFTDFVHEHIGRIDAKTGEVKLYEMPTKGASPRRAQMDSQGRLWIGEYRGNKIAMFDTKSETFQEWAAPTPWSSPYDVTLDKLGYAWTGSMSTDRVLRLNPKTGEFTEYLLPRSANIRRVFVDDRTPKPTFWVGNNQSASIIKLETLD